MESIKSWFNGLTEREQKIVSIGGVASLIALFYFLVWSPLNSSLETQKTILKNEQATLSWIQQQANRAAVIRQSGNKTSYSGSLTQLVNQTTRSAGIPISRMQPQGEELQVWIDQIAFNKLMSWLETLENQGVTILQTDFTEVDAQGYVQVRRLQLGKA